MHRTIHSNAALLCALILFNQLAYAASAPYQTATPQSPATSTSAQAAPAVATSPNAPVPAQIAAAHTVFVANTGADDNFPGDATQSYNSVYAALQAWGHYQLVSAPEQADLVFQLRDLAPITNVTGNHGVVYSLASPAFQLTILDAKSNVALWTITSPVNLAGKKQILARWQAISVTNLISRIKILANQPLTSTESADLTLAPRTHGSRNAVIVVAIVVGVGVGGGLLLHHLYENSLANGKASQDQFCEANNIPLNECAGG